MGAIPRTHEEDKKCLKHCSRNTRREDITQ